MNTYQLLPLLLLLSVFFAACGRHRPIATSPIPAPTFGGKSAPSVRAGDKQTGYASWYGEPFHGRRAANGEVYDMNKLTAAHLTLPFGTMTKVVNLENNRSVTVRITDRGPFVKGRIIDLSYAAALEIEMIGPGTAMVRLEILSAKGPSASGSYAVQVGAFRDRSAAERLQSQLRDRFGRAFIVDFYSDQGRFYRVRVGPRPTVLEANQLATKLGQENLPAFIVLMDN